jgi:hypothetical protein
VGASSDGGDTPPDSQAYLDYRSTDRRDHPAQWRYLAGGGVRTEGGDTQVRRPGPSEDAFRHMRGDNVGTQLHRLRGDLMGAIVSTNAKSRISAF